MIIHAPATIPILPDADPGERFMALALGGKNIFLSGMAGTGKSTLLRKFIGEVGAAGIDVDVTAPTGIAALNVDGATIHRWSGMMLGPGSEERDPSEDNETFYRYLLGQHTAQRGFDRIYSCRCLVIDEISMLQGRQFDFLEWLFRKRRRDERPWGGCQIIVVGDFFQLAPVQTDRAKGYDWCFAREAWARTRFKTVMLERIHRQSEVDFISALCGVRLGQLSDRQAATLSKRVIANPPEDIPHICVRNRAVDDWNDTALAGLGGETAQFVGQIRGNAGLGANLAKNLMCPETLKLKLGARVMATANEREGAYVNGTIGVVESMSGGEIVVRTPAGRVCVRPRTWTSGKSSLDAGGYAEYTQFPLRLAYSMTIHKCQGLTLDGAYVDIAAANDAGQCYVGISRVRTLKGLYLRGNPRQIFTSGAVKEFYARIEGEP